MMTFVLIFFAGAVCMKAGDVSAAQFPAPEKACLHCHQGIHPIRSYDSDMMKRITKTGRKANDPNGCVFCHGGDPMEKEVAEKAHSGAPSQVKLDLFTNHPGALGVNDKTCGQCHQNHTYAVRRSIMNTDAGKIKTILWSWGIGTESYDHKYGNYDIDDPNGPEPLFGTRAYKQYMKKLANDFPAQFPDKLTQIPEVNPDTVTDNPGQAAFAYLRSCNRCHLSVKGNSSRGSSHGMGCAACHVLYSGEGRYEGNDKALKKHFREKGEKPGFIMVHAIQSSRKTKTRVNGKTYSGILVSTCTSCHSSGRRTATTYQGLFPSYRGAPFTKEGKKQLPCSGNTFKPMRPDHHHKIYDSDGNFKGGLLCQDCHTTTAMHGNGNIGVTTLADIEVDCADCHGTPDKYPWELPAGYGEEFGRELRPAPRGVSARPMKATEEFATLYPARDGFLLSARGNPMGNVVKDGDKIVVHSASGVDFELNPLKRIKQTDKWKHPVKAKTNMVNIEAHMSRLECYACHSTWAPSYFGYHYKMDFSENRTSTDWLKSGGDIKRDGNTAESLGQSYTTPGSAVGSYNFYRWKNPVLGINGEGRVSPLVGCIQTVGSVVDYNGKLVVSNQVFRTAPGMENSSEEGQRAIEMQPLNPHSTSLESRDCFDCHGDEMAMGYGLDGGIYDDQPDKAIYTDTVDANGQQLSRYSGTQIEAINGLSMDLAQIVNDKGVQMQTVGAHWEMSGPLTELQRKKLDMEGACTACHRDLPSGTIPAAMLKKISEVANISFASAEEHGELLGGNNRLMALIKVAAMFGGAAVVVAGLFIFMVRRRK
ncbi:MAG: cytochrome C [Thermodesulfobacteriota bacterium]|nr:cytochrome C [Thermodesulfobacteriota bacterium]